MGEIQKVNTSISPLLKPVMERNYTKGMDPSGPSQNAASSQPVSSGSPADNGSKMDFTPPPPGTDSSTSQQQHTSQAHPEDFTKPFSFDEPVGADSDLADGEEAPGVTLPAGSAKSFANFVGNAIQMYLPKATYGYVKIDIEDVIVNVEKGNLTGNWIDTFKTINTNTEEALAISDDSIKMWKGAFKDYLEYKQVAFANPETAFYAATAMLLADQGIRAYQIKKTNERYMREAIEASNPGLFAKKAADTKKQEEKTTKINNNESRSESAAA